MSTALKDRLETAKAAQETGLTTTNSTGSVLGWLNAPVAAAELARALPAGMDAGRFARVVQTEIRKTPDLLKCTPQSFILAVLNAAQLGLEPGPLGHSYLVPFRNGKTNATECTLMLGYKGLKELAYRGDSVDLIDAVSVHEGEPFRIVRGSDPHLEHEELPECAENVIVAYYAIAIPKGGGRPAFEVMWPKDIEGIRKRSRAGTSGPWVTDFEAMAQKTVTRRMLNRGKVRLSAQIAEVIQEDEARELGYDRPELIASLAPLGAPEDKKPAKAKANKEEAAEEGGEDKPNEQIQEPPPSSAPEPEDPGAAFRSTAATQREE